MAMKDTLGLQETIVTQNVHSKEKIFRMKNFDNDNTYDATAITTTVTTAATTTTILLIIIILCNIFSVAIRESELTMTLLIFHLHMIPEC
jgi:hypothetical protein